jgi:PrtD family type I secretion system ABC transporter
MSKKTGETILTAALRQCRAHFIFAIGFNVFINVLLLVYPVFMFQVYDRVLTSHSIETLIALTIGLIIALVFKAIFQWARGALFVRAAIRMDRLLADRVLTALIERGAGGTSATGSQALRDLDSFRQFATGKGALAAIDAPWAVLFCGVLLVLDLQVGLVALFCTALMAAATIANSIFTKKALAETTQFTTKSYGFADANLRASEAIVAMGMVGAVINKWRGMRNPALDVQVKTSQRGVLFQAVLASARILVQAVIMIAAVMEILYSDAPNGMMMAALIVSGFAMRPIDQLVAAWDDYVPARQALKRIDALLSEESRSRSGTALPKPLGHLTCFNLFYIPPGGEQPILSNVNLAIRPGESLGLIGLNGSGKTTLARLLVGNLKPTRGHVRLDGADLWATSRDDIGRHIGYLPQNISILSGTVAENIGRYGMLSDEEIVDAAKAAGVHDIILRLPKGYDTDIGENGHPLSGGQRQLIALARAIAGSPSLVVLDEPNSNLDGQAEEALVACIAGLKERGISCVLITHRPTLVRDLDHAVILKEGHVASAGATENVFKRLGRPVVIKNAANNEQGVAQ